VKSRQGVYLLPPPAPPGFVAQTIEALRLCMPFCPARRPPPSPAPTCCPVQCCARSAHDALPLYSPFFKVCASTRCHTLPASKHVVLVHLYTHTCYLVCSTTASSGAERGDGSLCAPSMVPVRRIRRERPGVGSSVGVPNTRQVSRKKRVSCSRCPSMYVEQSGPSGTATPVCVFEKNTVQEREESQSRLPPTPTPCVLSFENVFCWTWRYRGALYVRAQPCFFRIS